MTEATKIISKKKEIFFHGKNFTRDFGYVQAVKVADTLYISGTVSIDDSGNLSANAADMGEQTQVIYEDIKRILTTLGATFSDVIKEGTLTTDIDRFQSEGMPVRAKFYEGHTLPASGAWIQVERLASPDFLIEIEATVLLP